MKKGLLLILISFMVSLSCFGTVGVITGTKHFCAGTTDTLSDTTAGGTWISKHTSIAYSLGGGVLIGVGAGTDSILYAVGTDTVYTVVTVNALPASITGTASICGVGDSTTLADDTTGGTWTTIGTTLTVGSATGKVTAHAQDTATIIYTARDGCKVTKLVTVNPAPRPITGTTHVCVGQTTPLSDTTTGGTWSASPPSATIGSVSGIVTGVSAGTSTIDYSTGAGCSVSVVVTVNAKPSVITGSKYVTTGGTDPLADSTTGGTWSTTSCSYFTINSASGLVTGASAGLCIVTYTLSDGCSVTDSVTDTNTITRVAMITGSATVCVGSSIPLADSTAGGTWSTSNSAIGSIGTTGDLVGIATGTVTVTYTVGTNYATTVISVNPVASISGPSDICIGSTILLTGTPTGGTWSSGSTTIASVSAGTVLGVGSGSTNIYYAAGGCFAYHGVTVSAVPGAITGTMTVTSGGTTHLSDTVSGGTWSSSCPTILSVGSTTGIVTGIASGSCIVTYSTGGCYVITTVTVSGTTIAAITGAGAVCVGDTITLADATSGGTWHSSNTAIATVGSASGIVVGVLAGTATISYEIGSSYVIKTVVVNPLPTVYTVTGGGSYCAGGVGLYVGLSGSSTGVSYELYRGSTAVTSLTGTGSALNFGPETTAGTYTIVATNTSTGCVSTMTGSAAVSVNPLPSSISGTTSVTVGGTTHLTDGTSGGTWSSSNGAIATVNSSSGLVTGVLAGTCTVTYELTTGCFVTATITVTNVTPISPIIGASTLCTGLTTGFTDTTSGGTWSSSNPTVATVGSTGLVSGLTAGTATITYTVGSSYVIETITVNPSPSSISGTTTVTVSGTTPLSDGTGGGSWISSNTGIASVNATSGLVTGVSDGSCIISYVLPTGCYAITTVTVTGTASIHSITGISTVCTGLTIGLTDSTSGGTWTSSDTLIAKVGPTGIVTGIASGTATITYTVGSSYVTKTITVNASPSSITGTTTVSVGGTTPLADGTGGGIWSSSSSSIASVNSTSGLVSGVSAGTCHITYTLTTGCYVATTVTVTGTTGSIAAITGSSVVCVGSSITLSDATTGGRWSSSDTVIAKVSSTTGVVIGYSSGTVTITYTVGSSYVTTTVTVSSGSTITGSSVVCTGSAITLTASISGGTWTTGDTAVASVSSSSGVVTGLTSGVANIYYYSGGCYTYHTVTVNPTATIGGSSTLCTSSTTTLTASIGGGTWSSSNTSIATVSSGGVVTPVSAGTVTINYTVGGCTSSFIISINSPATISGASTLCAGSSATLTASIADGSWSSSNTALATVSTTGVVTTVGAGVVNIYYSIGGCTSYHTVTVDAAPTISGSSTLCIGNSATLTASVSGGSWSSSNTAVATVSSTGIVTPVSAGIATISYSTGSGCAGTYTVTVNAAATITGASSLCAGSTIALSASISGGSWSSSNTAIATVGATGIVTGVGPGVVNIYYSSGGCGAYHTVTVNASATISGSSTLCSGSTTTLTASVSGGTWSSSNTAIATVSSSGVVTAVTSGVVTISYSTGSGCAASQTVSVSATTSISGSSGICVGSTTTLSGSPAGGTWSSGNTAIATVSASGVVTAVSAGVVNIYYSAGGCSGYHTVSTNAAPSISGSSTVCVGGSTTLSSSPSGGAWSSSNTAVATVSTSGIVTGATTGVANISYTIGGCSVDHTVTVQAATSTISGSSSVCVGSTTTLTGSPSGGTWSSSFTISATISSSGVLTGISAGTSTIYYGVGGCYAYRTETVVPLPASITGTETICEGSTITLADATTGGTWSSSNTSIATVNATTGMVTGVGVGIANISYTAGGCSTGRPVTVDVAPAAITGSTTVASGSSITLSDAVGGGTWLSGNSSVASVNPTTGRVTGVSPGSVTIYYTIGSCSVYVEVIVIGAPSAPESPATSSINDVNGADNTIAVYPNPTTGNVNIQWGNQTNGTAYVSITDVTGRAVYTSAMEINATSGLKQFDLSNLKDGLYLITIKSDNINYTGKLLINK